MYMLQEEQKCIFIKALGPFFAASKEKEVSLCAKNVLSVNPRRECFLFF